MALPAKVLQLKKKSKSVPSMCAHKACQFWPKRAIYYVNQPKDTVTLCTLGIGTAFGESILDNSPHSATVVTNEHCELLRIEQKDFKAIWEVMGIKLSAHAVYYVVDKKKGFTLIWKRNRHLMEDIVSPISTLRTLTGLPLQDDSKTSNGNVRSFSPLGKKDSLTPDGPNPALPITQEPSTALSRAGWVLRTLILCQSPHLIRDRKYHVRTFRKCLVGSEMVDWLMHQGAIYVRIHSRSQAVGMWQALMEEGVISHVTNEHQFKDKYLFYRFREDQQEISSTPILEDKQQAEAELPEVLANLLQLAPDAVFRMILRKSSSERTDEDLEIIYEELLHIKALSHLSNSVKRELAGVLVFESHPKAGTVLFNQGDEGKSWFIILKGSVNVVIYGKGIVCSLHEGDDFGKLALVNDAPRAATIVTRENNCHFLRVDKDDFNNIIRDVEANTVRLKEHGQDVLLLQKIPTDGRGTTDGTHSHYKYMVMAGTPQKMLEHLLETRIDQRNDDATDTFLEDFLLTHVIFMPSHQLCPELMRHYRIDATNCRQEKEFIIANKKRVIQFVQIWTTVIRSAFFEDECVASFLQELHEAVIEDCKKYGLHEELSVISRILETKQKYDKEVSGVPHRWKVGPYGQIRLLSTSESQEEERTEFRRCIKATDEVVFRVYCADHTYTTIKTPVGATAEAIKRSAAEKLGFKDDLLLIEVKSTAERVIFKDSEVSVPTGLSVNGRIFLTPANEVDLLTPLPEQDGPSDGTGVILETLNSLDIAYNMTVYEWDLFHVFMSIISFQYELIYQVFGRHQFRKIMSNLDVFLRRFNEVQHWVATEMTLCNNLSRRVALLRKFIKIAAHCREYQNMNSFFAIVLGLSNVAVNPSRNHRRYRLTVSKMVPPIIPFMPLLLKDMTFSHEGNKTYMEGLLNFEKMHMIAQTLRTIRHCRSQPLVLDPPPGNKCQQDVRNYIRNLRIIDNQKRLTQLSDMLEPRRTT
ncbi:rap guanine nucleotide exchange factor 4 [Trichonephila inaurata madagascariensis]|uniref:Rap guanine nucleotide exchange factor 4 n=1 Tax=Trichonephila inaurata madagascariensis TaxID=2747483 RepID=A0A8X6JEE0_9ARAC|nr:rap guanine nucleotide exchange factor 4 [Trichonephila inaurata madagascariensis]